MKQHPYRPFISFLSDPQRVDPADRAIIYRDEDISYGELNRRAERAAARLAKMGIGAGDHIAILGKNSIDFFVLLFGAMKMGAVATPINWRLVAAEIAYIVGDSESRILFHDAEFSPIVEGIAADVSLVKIGGSTRDSTLDAWLEGDVQSFASSPGAPDDVILQIYTSGTTGHPKGAMLSNASFMRYFVLQDEDVPDWWQTRRQDIALVAMPLFHVGGLETALRVLAIGGTCVVQREFDPSAVLEAIELYRPTLLALVPTALRMVFAEPRAGDVDFGCIRTMFYGAAPMPLDLLRQSIEVANCDFVQCFGLTESGGTVVALAPSDHSIRGTPQMRSAGRPIIGTDVKIVDGEGMEVPAGEVGEILLRSPYSMRGYWKRDAANAETIDAEGWLHTGDAGIVDDLGYVYIQDRIKDMIVSGGENIYPAEVENAIFGHPMVAEVAVIGRPDEKWGESVLALVVPAADARPDPAELIAYARERLAAYKVPRSILFVDELPKNASGKYLKTELRKRHGAA